MCVFIQCPTIMENSPVVVILVGIDQLEEEILINNKFSVNGVLRGALVSYQFREAGLPGLGKTSRLSKNNYKCTKVFTTCPKIKC